jgi:hypothetical protein
MNVSKWLQYLIFKYCTRLYLFIPCFRPSWKHPLYPAALCHLYVNCITLLTIPLKGLNILMVFTWELSAKNNSLPSLCVASCSFHALVRKVSLNNVRSTYLQPHSFFHYLSFICVLSLSARSKASGLHVSRIYHSYFVSGTSKPTWVRVESSVRFFLKTLKMLGTVVTIIHRYFILVCHWLSGMIVLLCIWNVLD